jgi:hypothetical protein
MTHVMPVSFWLVKLLLAAMMLALLNGGGAGCASSKKQPKTQAVAKADKSAPKAKKATKDAFFPDESEMTPVEHFSDAQIAAGASRDATLRTYHFTGNTINSLGRELLDLMVANRAADQTVAVYLGMNEDDKRVEPRRERVVAYLSEAGLAKDQFELHVGHNPELLSPAAPIMARLIKTESGTAQGFKPEDAQKSAVAGGK